MGWDNGITGNINASGVGEINNQVVVVTRNTYNDVYGAGLHMKFGGGYLFDDTSAPGDVHLAVARRRPHRRWATSGRLSCPANTGLSDLRPRLSVAAVLTFEAGAPCLRRSHARPRLHGQDRHVPGCSGRGLSPGRPTTSTTRRRRSPSGQHRRAVEFSRKGRRFRADWACDGSGVWRKWTIWRGPVWTPSTTRVTRWTMPFIVGIHYRF